MKGSNVEKKMKKKMKEKYKQTWETIIWCACPIWEDGGSMSVSVPGYLYTAQTIQTTLTTYDTTMYVYLTSIRLSTKKLIT